MDLTERKKQILKRVVEDYIAAAEPVGSKALAEEMGGSVSSATIRNELADLVEMGYLEQPHTSAGRVPSPKGYRLYVNELMEKREVSETEAEEIPLSGVAEAFLFFYSSKSSAAAFGEGLHCAACTRQRRAHSAP